MSSSEASFNGVFELPRGKLRLGFYELEKKKNGLFEYQWSQF
jgi:hypothetical protein